MGNIGINAPHGSELDVTIVGAGINGLMTAYFLSSCPGVRVRIFEAQSDPRLGRRPNDLSPTFGGQAGSNTVRHITGSESLVPPVGLPSVPAWFGHLHSDATSSSGDKKEHKTFSDLTRIEASHVSSADFDPYHALLNYAGLELWLALSRPELLQSIMTRDGMNVYYQDGQIFREDVQGDTRLYLAGHQINRPIVQTTNAVGYLSPVFENCFSIPGMTLDIRQYGIALLNTLSARDNVDIVFGAYINEKPVDCDVVIWASNSTHAPAEGNAITGLMGYWTSIDNSQLGITEPFKYFLEFPMGVVNVTPDRHERLQISGGLFWVDHFGPGARELVRFHKPEFLSQLKTHFPFDEVQQLTLDDVSGCIRPCGPQGLPVLKFTEDEVDISGGSKSGTTQAPIIASAVLEHLGFDAADVMSRCWGDPTGLLLMRDALNGIQRYAQTHRPLEVSM